MRCLDGAQQLFAVVRNLVLDFPGGSRIGKFALDNQLVEPGMKKIARKVAASMPPITPVPAE